MSTTREQLDRLLTLFRRGVISEDVLLDQLEQVASDANGDVGEENPSAPPQSEPPEMAQGDIAALLDEFRAAEVSGAETLSRWAELSEDPRLTGGLRVLAAREFSHAVLLEHRLRELGGEPSAEVPAWLAGFNKALVASESTDVERLGALVAQFADLERATERIDRAIAITDDDELTRELLLAIKIDELITIDWLRDAYRDRNGDDEQGE